jgi:hypothetical protein
MSAYWNNNFSPGEQWYEIDIQDPPTCRHCEDKEQSLDCAKEFLETIVNMLYSKNTLNIESLEENLDQLCHFLRVKVKPGDLQIQRIKHKPPIQVGWITLIA